MRSILGQLDVRKPVAYQDVVGARSQCGILNVILFVAAAQAMFIRAFMRGRLIVPGSVPNRTVALACAVALLIVTFAHSIHHFAGSAPTNVVQENVNTSDTSPDSSNKASIMIEHCQGCSMIAMVVLAQPVVPNRIAADLPMRRVDEKRPHSPAVEIPPPIAMI
jgi:hypothetical protein